MTIHYKEFYENKFPKAPQQMSKYQLCLNIAYYLIIQEPSNAEYLNKYQSSEVHGHHLAFRTS